MFISRALFPTLVLLCANDIWSDVKYFDGVRCHGSTATNQRLARDLSTERNLKGDKKSGKALKDDKKSSKAQKETKGSKGVKASKSIKGNKKSKKGKQPAEKFLTVMTRNIYLGADLNLIESLTDPVEIVNFVGSVVDILENDTKFPVRAGLLADEILETKPDLIGIQEAATFVFTDPLGAETTLDYLTILLEELTLRGLNYAIAVITDPVPYLPPFPSDFFGGTAFFKQSDAILVNTDNTSLDITAIDAGLFSDQQVIATPLGEFPIMFGWCFVDGVYKGKSFRFGNTHLNGDDTGALNEAQAQEFIDKVVSTTGFPTVVVGDMNANPEGTTYSDGTETYNLMTESLHDAWKGDEGYTSGTDEKLIEADFSERIDYIFYDAQLKIKDIVLVGEVPSRSTPPLYASDHVGVVASLSLL